MNITAPSIVKRQFRLNDHMSENLVCPFCESVPHMQSVEFGRHVPPNSTSGNGLIIHFCCEGGHFWFLEFADNSGGTWLTSDEEKFES